ncbi:imelysin family protein [Marinobacter lacisalsi]|uniref:Imelysin family protein n=1 Tax=Marinobacter lacisalsi TaxID=475979 RepID=A0ABV8QEA7_9GAMM
MISRTQSSLALLAAAATTLAGCASPGSDMARSEPVSKADVVEHYADLAHANYEDALLAAVRLDDAVDQFIEAPSPVTLEAAKSAWLEARVPYQQTEVFRFGNAIVDDWEGQLNAWPLDEGLIDYVEPGDYQYELGNEGATANIIASESTINVGGEAVNVTVLDAELLASLNEIGGSEANVATGYHAIEFLLWGQDTYGFELGAGERSYTDYVQSAECTNGNCARRAAYLDAATDLLVDDLAWMEQQWAEGLENNYRSKLLATDADVVIQKMLFGMGSLSLGELAGERMKVALEANSYEDEHDCFSDNTHNSHYYNGKGIQNVYTGTYERVDGSKVTGPALSDLVRQQDPELDNTLRSQLEASMAALGTMKQVAERDRQPMPFDVMIAPGNEKGEAIINSAITALVEQTESIEMAAIELGIESLEPDDAGHRF